MITFSNVSYSRSALTLVENFDLTLFSGESIGIVGANGCGKSTLFQLILGDLGTDTGSIDTPSSLRIAHVRQDTPDVKISALDYVLDGDKALRDAQQKLKLAEQNDNGEAIALAHQQLEIVGAYDAESRASRLLFGLGFSESQMRTNINDLSGGWRVRLNLAQALIQTSDVLLLDEPTNHLDLDAVFWLESFLKSYAGTLLIISHDRDFLDAIVSRVLHFSEHSIKSYSGNYSQFLRIKSEQEMLQQKQFEKQQAKVKHLQSFIDRFKAKASKAKQAQSRVKALERMASVENISIREKLSFEFLEPKHKPDPLVTFDNMSTGYGETKVLTDISLSIRCDSRIGLLGRNGAGKSTLLKTLANTEVTVEGKREASKHLSVGYFAQHQLEQLSEGKSAFAQLQHLDENLTEQQIRNYLGGFAFHGDKVFEPAGSFSGGEKARLVLALIIYQKPNLILLDEPTNHLDMEMRDALTMAIQNFSGAVVLISHDRFLLDATVDELYLVNQGEVQPFSGDTKQYYHWLKQNRWSKTEKAKTAEDVTDNQPPVDRKTQKQREAKARQLLAPYRKKLVVLEKNIEVIQQELLAIEEAMGDTELYSDSRKQELNDCIGKQAELKSRLEEDEIAWFDLQEEVEQKTEEINQQFECANEK